MNVPEHLGEEVSATLRRDDIFSFERIYPNLMKTNALDEQTERINQATHIS